MVRRRHIEGINGKTGLNGEGSTSNKSETTR